MIIKYFADDGTVFDDRFDCVNYEKEQLARNEKISKGLYMWDRLGQILTVNDFEKAWYVFIKDKKTLDFLNETITLYSSFPDEVGSWIYDERQDCFIPLDEVISEMEKKLKMCKDFEYQAITATKAPF